MQNYNYDGFNSDSLFAKKGYTYNMMHSDIILRQLYPYTVITLIFKQQMISLPFQLQHSSTNDSKAHTHDSRSEECLLTKIFLLSLQNHRLSTISSAHHSAPPTPLADRISQMERSLAVELDGKNKRIQSLNSEVMSLNSQLMSLKNDRIRLQSNNTTAQAIQEAYLHQLSSMRVELAHANQIIVNLKQTKQKQQSEQSKVDYQSKADNQSLQNKYTLLHRDHTQLAQAIKTGQQQHNLIKDECLKHKQENTRIKQQNIKIKQENTRIRQQSTRIREQLIKAKEQSKKYRQECTKVDMECTTATQQCIKLRDQARSLKEQLLNRPTNEQYTRIQGKLKDYDMQYMHYSREMSSTASMVNSLKANISNLEQSIDKLNKQNQSLRKQNMGDIWMERLKSYELTIKEMEVDCRKLQEQQGLYQRQAAKAQQEIKKVRRERDDVIGQWQSVMKELSTQKQIINTLQSELDRGISAQNRSISVQSQSISQQSQHSSVINSSRQSNYPPLFNSNHATNHATNHNKNHNKNHATNHTTNHTTNHNTNHATNLNVNLNRSHQYQQQMNRSKDLTDLRQLNFSKELKNYYEDYNGTAQKQQRSYQEMHTESNLMEKMLDSDSRHTLSRNKSSYQHRSVDKFQKYLSFQLPQRQSLYASKRGNEIDTSINTNMSKQRQIQCYTDVKTRQASPMMSRVSSEQKLHRPSYSSTNISMHTSSMHTPMHTPSMHTSMHTPSMHTPMHTPTPSASLHPTTIYPSNASSLHPSNASTARGLDQGIPTIADQKKMLIDKLNNMNLSGWDHKKKADISMISKGRGKLQIKGRCDLLRQKENIQQLISQKYPRP